VNMVRNKKNRVIGKTIGVYYTGSQLDLTARLDDSGQLGW
jgi:hypothetical protein